MLRSPRLEFHTLVDELIYVMSSFELACRRLFWGRDDVPLSL